MVKWMILILWIALPATICAQQQLRTFATVLTSGPNDTWKRYEGWGFHYDDQGDLDSIRITGDVNLSFGGLQHVRPFVRDFLRWENLPPNLYELNSYGTNAQCVLVAPIPGRLELHTTNLSYDGHGIERDTDVYLYDVKSGRILSSPHGDASYEDSNGLIRRIVQDRSNRRFRSTWEIHRDLDGRIVGLESRRSSLRGDSLTLNNFYQILRWQDGVSPYSVQPDNGFTLSPIPYLPEGTPAVRLQWSSLRTRGEYSGPTLIQLEYDSLDRLIGEHSSAKREIEYGQDGAVRRDVKTSPSGFADWTRTRTSHNGPSGSVWKDVLDTWEGSEMEYRQHEIAYEYGYRYDDGLQGDKMAPLIIYGVSKDTAFLTIDDQLPTEGLTACVIDTTEREIVQIPLTGRKTTFILPALQPRMLHAIRWKYRGRKIVDQVF